MGLVLVGTNTDYTTVDLEDLIYRDIGNKWSLTAPTYLVDITKAKLFGTTVKADMVNKPFQGFGMNWIWVQHRRTEANRTTLPQPGWLGATLGAGGIWPHRSTFDINIFSKRLTKRALEFPELGQIAREIQRILVEYPTVPANPEILGVQHFDNWVMENVNEATNMGEGYAGVYRMICSIDALYAKEKQ